MTGKGGWSGLFLSAVILCLSVPAPSQGGPDPEDAILRATRVTRWSDSRSKPETYADYLKARGAGAVDSPLITQIVYQSPSNIYNFSKRVDLLVHDSLVAPLAGRFQEYCHDLELQGWGVTVFRCTGGTPPEVRTFLAQRYTRDTIVGATIVGDLPVPWFEMDDDFDKTHSEFPCDLYYMDLDGTWGDADLDGMFDSHTANEKPEIFIGRLTAGPLVSVGGSEVGMLDNYFRKVHDYRLGVLTAPDRALSYPDDDWATMNTGQHRMYSNVVAVTDKATTTAADYRTRLNQGFSSVVLCAHSTPLMHAFYSPSGPGGTLSSNDIWTLDPPCLFYNLFACSAARYTSSRYIAGMYTFAKTKGLITVGSTKAGSMQMFDDYYRFLAKNMSFGEAFRSWFAARHPYSLSDRQWHYGMTLLGDPTLRVGVPVTLTRYGSGCPGSFNPNHIKTIVPQKYATTFGNRFSYYVLGGGDHRFQQVFADTEVPASFSASSIGFRHDDQAVQAEQNYWIELAISLGYCPNPPSSLSRTFSANAQTMTQVLQKKSLSLPYWNTLNSSPANFLVKIPLDAPFTYTAQAGKYLIMDVLRTNSSNGSSSTMIYMDSFSESSPVSAGMVMSSDPSSTTGAAIGGMGLVVGFGPALGGSVVPTLGYEGLPALGGNLLIRMSMARANTPIGLGIGFSHNKWGGLSLPLDLSPFGAPGCQVLASLDLVLANQTDQGGDCSTSFILPADRSFYGTTLYFQGVVMDAPANQLGMVWTNGLKLKVGY